MNTTIFNESLDLSEAQFDGENNILRGVILIRAGMSANRRHYSEDILQKAAPLFEGVKAYDSHKIGVPRQVGEITGWFSNVRYENGALRADRHFSRTRSGQDVRAIAEDIVTGRAPRSLAGLSINAVGTGKQQKFPDGDGLNVESITAANSVDDVTVPAAGGTYLTASTNGDEIVKQIINALTFEEYFAARPDYIQRIQKEMKTIRQDDAVKAAKAEADRIQADLSEAQNQLNTLKAERDAALAEAQGKARELLLEKTLNKAQLPVSWKVSLREQLEKADPQEWDSIIEREIDKSKIGQKRIEITGADQQVAQPITEATKPTRNHPNWDVILSSPENFAAWKSKLI